MLSNESWHAQHFQVKAYTDVKVAVSTPESMHIVITANSHHAQAQDATLCIIQVSLLGEVLSQRSLITQHIQRAHEISLPAVHHGKEDATDFRMRPDVHS